MKSITLKVELPSIDELEQSFESNYKDIFISSADSGKTRLYSIEKYYKRIGTEVGGFVLIEPLEGATCFIQLWVLGGQSSPMRVDHGAQNHFAKEMQDLITKHATRVIQTDTLLE